jgi:hypothetical protein
MLRSPQVLTMCNARSEAVVGGVLYLFSCGDLVNLYFSTKLLDGQKKTTVRHKNEFILDISNTNTNPF